MCSMGFFETGILFFTFISSSFVYTPNKKKKGEKPMKNIVCKHKSINQIENV